MKLNGYQYRQGRVTAGCQQWGGVAALNRRCTQNPLESQNSNSFRALNLADRAIRNYDLYLIRYDYIELL